MIAEALAVAGVEPATHRLRRGARHRHAARRPDRGAGADAAPSGATPSARGFCALGSVKTNIGHLDAAAGVAGLIKTVLALEHRQIPPTPALRDAQPADRLRRQPVLRQRRALADWPRAGATPRRAGVSSFGIGGTNAHVVLEEAPGGAASPSRGPGRSSSSRRAPRRPSSAPPTRSPHSRRTRSCRSPTSPTRCRPGAAPSPTAGRWSAGRETTWSACCGVAIRRG